MLEPIFRKPGQQFRPFSESAGITPRGCSLVLQRIVVDFGADQAFGRVPHKLKEHYGIELPVSTIRQLTEQHGQWMYEQKAQNAQHEAGRDDSRAAYCAVQVGEMDGSMLPIVSINETAEDRRKLKTLSWKEVRLAMAHELGSTTPKFGAVFQGSVDEVGEALLKSARLAGFGPQTYLHSVGDGAPWIAQQVADKFGAQGSYLVDFYPVCDYLQAVAKICAPGQEKTWTEAQKQHLKNSDYQQVLNQLSPYREADDIADDHAPVRACHRYLSNRTDQLDYKTALEKRLPIGSGEIESAHRYVIQERLKLPGAWWKAENVEAMLALRVTRANQQWDAYWDKLPQAA